MLPYGLKLRFLKIFKHPFMHGVASSIGIKSGDDIRAILVKKFAPGKSFADIGCMWRVQGKFSFLAQSCGAKRVVAVDLYEEEEFKGELRRRNPNIEFIRGDILSKEVIDRIGNCDIVFCSGVLYHMPDPLQFLTVLHSLCNETLILATLVIPEKTGTRNHAVFYPFLTEKERRLYSPTAKRADAVGAYNHKTGYTNWFWGCAPSCVESMLKYAQFEAIERYIRPFQAFFVCRPQKQG